MAFNRGVEHVPNRLTMSLVQVENSTPDLIDFQHGKPWQTREVSPPKRPKNASSPISRSSKAVRTYNSAIVWSSILSARR